MEQDASEPKNSTCSLGLNWRDRLILLIVGAGMSGFLFGGIVGTDISSSSHLVFTKPASCHAYLIKAKYGSVYGTYFEYIAVTYGPWGMWGVLAASTPFIALLRISQRSRTFLAQILVAAAAFMGIYYWIWHISDHLLCP